MAGTTGPDLGRVIFSRGGDPGTGVACVLAGALIGTLVIGGGIASGGAANAFVGVLGGALLGGGLIAAGVRSIRYRAAIHERGVVVFNGFFEQRIRFDQTRTFSYRHRTKAGAHQMMLTLFPFEGRPATIEVNPRWLVRSHEQLERLRDRLTTRFADAMERELRRKGSVDWVVEPGTGLPSTRFSLTPDGYVIGLRKGERRFLYSQIEILLSNGTAFFKDRSSGERVCASTCGVANFYPGLALVQRLTGPPTPAPIRAS